MNKPPRFSWPERVTGSLGLRVFLVCMVLVVIPLLLHIFIIYRQDYLLKMRDLFSELTIIGSGRERLLEEIITARRENLNLIARALSGKTLTEREQLLQQIKEEEGLETLLYLPEGEGIREPFLSTDSLTGVKQFYVASGNLLSGVSAQQLVNHLALIEGGRYPFYLSLVDQEGSIFVREGSKISKQELVIFTLEDIEKRSLFTKLVRIDKKGKHIGLKLPIKGTSFSLLIDVPQEGILEVERHEFFSRVSTLFLLILVLGGGGAIWLTRRMARPLKALCQVMERVGEGDVRARFQKDPMGFEINVLGKNFNHMIDSLFRHMEEAKNERVARELLESELNIGHEIQKSILPREMPQVPHLEMAAGFLAAREVAGDFYDLFYKEEEQQLLFAVADASGKGISACLYSLCMRSMLRSFAASRSELSEMITLTNNLFCQDTGDSGTFVTAWIASLDLRTRRLHYSSCGHPPALIKRRNGQLEELSTPNMALGVMPFEKLICASMQLFPGDQLLLYTDGLLEAHDAQRNLFGKERLREMVSQAQDLSAQQLVSHFLERVALFERGAPQFDDLTLLVIKIL